MKVKIPKSNVMLLYRDSQKLPLQILLERLDRHPKRAALIKIGKTKDELARALVPLLLAKGQDVEVTSCTSSKFWRLHGCKLQAPRIARALRIYIGYARMTKTGRSITPNGEKYLQHLIQAHP